MILKSLCVFIASLMLGGVDGWFRAKVACASMLKKNYCLKLIMIFFINNLFLYQFLRFGILIEAYLILIYILPVYCYD